MVHKPIHNWQSIDDASVAVDKEWHKLEKGHLPPKQQSEQGAWDLSRVRPKEDVKQEAARLGKVVHFGALLTLCHQKHAELAEALRSYKGRIVFRGDCVKTNKGEYAVFSEQGTSANQAASTKIVDATAHAPGCIGEDSDAMSAYTQIKINILSLITHRKYPNIVCYSNS